VEKKREGGRARGREGGTLRGGRCPLSPCGFRGKEGSLLGAPGMLAGVKIINLRERGEGKSREAGGRGGSKGGEGVRSDYRDKRGWTIKARLKKRRGKKDGSRRIHRISSYE